MSADSIADLLPCPFCKKAPSHVECMDIGMLGIEHKYAVMCYCGAQGPEAVGQSPERVERKAAKLWNRRALPSLAELERDAGREGQIVAWRYPCTKNGKLTGSYIYAKNRDEHDRGWEPLFTHPAPKSDAEYVIQLLIAGGLVSPEKIEQAREIASRVAPAKADAAADWVCVPRVPTEEMIVAFAETWFKKRRCIDDPEIDDAYAALIEASPAPKSVEAADDNAGRICPHGVVHGAPCNDCVICPGCCHQFPAIPVNVQKRLFAASPARGEK
jgi:hypothetical protein